ncbi:MAG: DNA polymerase IV [Dehalococcoidales bacterium]|nr:DNA polymerase IV [Dehalococcoidales bacterium]
MSERTIIHIDLDAFFVSVERVLNPELNGKPVVVGGSPDRRGVVATASYEARKFGLHSAMPLVTAARLCPHAIFIEGNFARYRDFSRRFMTILNDFSPFIEPGGLDEAYLDVTGFESLHGSIMEMAIAMKQRIRAELGLPASIGIASCKIVAKVASDFSKPDGLVEVPSGGERDFLAPLAVDKLPGVGKQTVKVLNGLGVRTIGDLARMPSHALRVRFGVAGETMHRHANGIDDSQVMPPGEAKSISRETTFGEDTCDRAFLEATLWTQSEKVGADLRKQGRDAKCVTLKLRYGDFTTITRSHTLPQSLCADKEIFDIGIILLHKALAVEKQGVRLIGIGVSHLAEPSRQTALFTPSGRKLEELNKAIDRIRNRYGFGAIQTGRAVMLKDLIR